MPSESETSRERERRLTTQQRNRRFIRIAGPAIGIPAALVSVLQLTSGGNASSPAIVPVVTLLLCSWVLVAMVAVRPWRSPRMHAKLAQEVLAEDPRPPVVYLRPFGADGRRSWYEERIALPLRALGPVITVGRPHETLPATRHIARDYLPYEEWQAGVLDLMRSAALVIVHIGTSEGLAWELEQVIDLGQPEKLVVCLGPDAVPRLTTRPQAGATYRQFRDRFGEVFPSGLPASVDRSAFLTFTSDWTPILSEQLDGRAGPLDAHLRRMHTFLVRRRVA